LSLRSPLGDGETQGSKIDSAKPESIKFAEPRSDTARRFYPSSEQQWPIHLRHQVCGAKQRQGRAVYPALEQKPTIHFLEQIGGHPP
jgi:hypothetical protein